MNKPKLKQDVKDFIHRAYVEIPSSLWNNLTILGKIFIGTWVIPTMYVLFTFTLLMILITGSMIILFVKGMYLFIKKETLQ